MKPFEYNKDLTAFNLQSLTSYYSVEVSPPVENAIIGWERSLDYWI